MEEELELLQEIFIDELSIEKRLDTENILKISLTPSTGGRWDEKYVFLDLHITLDPTTYPDTVPTFSLHTVRGVSDEHQARIIKELNVAAYDKVGEFMLYDLIQSVQETLTDNNMPAGNCPICLESFIGYCHFTITECTHYFHMACLNEHLRHVESTEDKEARCPSCREILDHDYVDALQRNTKELGLKCNLHKPDSEAFFLDQTILEQQKKYQEIYKRQQANNSFFTGEESHVLDLRTTNRTRTEVALPTPHHTEVALPEPRQPEVALPPSSLTRSTLLEVALPIRKITSKSPLSQHIESLPKKVCEPSGAEVCEPFGAEALSCVEEASTSQEDKTMREVEKKDLLKEENNSSLIISFSSLMENNPETPEPRNLDNNQAILGSTGSTAPSITPLEDSQSEHSLLSHEVESPQLTNESPQLTNESPQLTDESPQLTNEGDDLCYTDEEYCLSENVVEGDEVRGDNLICQSSEEDEEESEISESLPQDEDICTETAVIAEVKEEKEVTFAIPEKEDEEKESCSVSTSTQNTQTKRPKRNRHNKKQREQGEKSKYYRNDKVDGGERSTQKRGQYRKNYDDRRFYHHNKHNNYQGGEEDVCYRQTRGGPRPNRANCMSYHEDMSKQQQGPHLRRHSFTGQESFGVPRGPVHHDTRGKKVNRRGNEQPRFKPPRILRQEALEQARKVNESLEQEEHHYNNKPIMHKIPVSMYNPGGPTTSMIPNYHVLSGYHHYLDQHQLYQQALGGYHPVVTSTQTPSQSSSAPTSNQAPRAMSPNTQKIFDVARFQQNILRSNVTPNKQ